MIIEKQDVVPDKYSLFDFAKKELSQDAVISWLLCGEYGKAFLKDMCKSLPDPDKFTIERILVQEESIDILAEVKDNSNGKLYAVIIEDKTDTYLHNFQMLRYIEKISEKGGKRNPTYAKIYFVLFKTGDIYHWEQQDYNHWQNLIAVKREFTAEELNEGRYIKGVAISDSIATKGFFLGKQEQHISAENIYTLDDFKSFIKDKNCGFILKYYKEYLDNKRQEIDLCKKDYEFVKSVIGEMHLDMVRPGGGGKREYEYNILSEDMLEYKRESNSIYDNFLILPHILRDETEYKFMINCQIIGNPNKIHGYTPWSDMNAAAKDKFRELKQEIWAISEEIMTEEQKKNRNNSFCSSKLPSEENEDKKDNRLRLYTASGDLCKERIEEIINLSKKIAKALREKREKNL